MKVIDCHGHYTTAPRQQRDYRRYLLDDAGGHATPREFDQDSISDDEIRSSLENAQLLLQRQRGTDIAIFSPRAGGMDHHQGNQLINAKWARACNNLIKRVCELYPRSFAAACMLPQAPGAPMAACIDELERCVSLGFVAANVNPDPSGGYWTGPPMTDRYWYPLYEKLVEFDMPAMIHVSASCNPNFHGTGAHYLAADTTVFMQLVIGDLFSDFPDLRMIIPHGGGAVPYHWGRYRGLAQDLGRPALDDGLLRNVFFDTCVYHQPGIELLTRVIPNRNILFASEMVGAVKGIDPRSGRHYDDTKGYLDMTEFLSYAEREAIFAGNALRVFPRLKTVLPELLASD